MRRRLSLSGVVLVLAAGLLVPVAAAPVAAQVPTVDYDVDDDGLIEVSSLERLNAIRWDLDGDGTADVYPADSRGNTGHDPQGAVKYAAAFPNAAAQMGCPSSGCDGYELSADLDFDTNASGTADAGDEYWNGGKGWVPLIGGEAIYDWWADVRFEDGLNRDFYGSRPNSRARMFTAIFEGNGRTIANLFIDDPDRWYVGLFGYLGPGAKVRNVGLSAPNSDSRVRGNWYAGALAGDSEGARVSGVWSDVDVTGGRGVGGLVGVNWRQAFVIESYATGDVSGENWIGGLVGMLNVSGVAAVYATGDVTVTGDNPKQNCYGGGLVGLRSGGHVRATYATGSVTGTGNCRMGSSDGTSVTKPWIGGLIGALWHPGDAPWMRASYAVGQVSAAQGAGPAGGLTGSCEYMHPGRVGGSNYWDTEASGIATSSACSVGYTTAQLQAPTGYTGIYADWNVDVHVGGYHGAFNGPGDDPWDFGTSSQYPVLKYCAAKPGIDTADGGPYCPLQPANQRPSLTVTLEDSDVGTQDPDIDADGEQPSTDQPSADQPPADGDADRQPADGRQPSTEQPVVGEQPPADQPSAEQPLAEQPVVGEQPPAEQQQPQPAEQQQPQPADQQPAEQDQQPQPVVGEQPSAEQQSVDDVVSVGYTVDARVVARVQVLAGRSQHGEAHVNRWRRVLVAFGVDDGVGVSGGAMSAARAQKMADRYGSPVWDEVVVELILLEASPLVARVQVLAGRSQHGEAHVNRWRRVLVAFGVDDGVGVSGGAMSAARAQKMADRYSSPVWDEVVVVLTALEAARTRL